MDSEDIGTLRATRTPDGLRIIEAPERIRCTSAMLVDPPFICVLRLRGTNGFVEYELERWDGGTVIARRVTWSPREEEVRA